MTACRHLDADQPESASACRASLPEATVTIAHALGGVDVPDQTPLTLPLPLTLKPMEAEAVADLPSGPGLLYEPKYDGFRCLAFRDGGAVRLQSRKQRPLARYFPELACGLEAVAQRFVIDGEIVLLGQSFEALQLRLHPARSRIEKLSAAHPATLIAFDLLVDAAGRDLTAEPFEQRREALEALIAAARPVPSLVVSKATRRRASALAWLGREGLDGIVAKRLDLHYQPGVRAMAKFKRRHTIDCVVGGLYRNEETGAIESLLLGLYGDDGALNYVGRVPVHRDAAVLARQLEPLIGGEGFTGKSPGGRNRWTGKERKPVPLRPVRVAEVSADHITGDYMRHGARFVRWRDDKRPGDCTMEQIRQPKPAPT